MWEGYIIHSFITPPPPPPSTANLFFAVYFTFRKMETLWKLFQLNRKFACGITVVPNTLNKKISSIASQLVNQWNCIHSHLRIIQKMAKIKCLRKEFLMSKFLDMLVSTLYFVFQIITPPYPNIHRKQLFKLFLNKKTGHENFQHLHWFIVNHCAKKFIILGTFKVMNFILHYKINVTVTMAFNHIYVLLIWKKLRSIYIKCIHCYKNHHGNVQKYGRYQKSILKTPIIMQLHLPYQLALKQ